MGDEKPAPIPQPEPLPPAEHEKAVKQAERQEENRRGMHDAEEDKRPQTHTSDD